MKIMGTVRTVCTKEEGQSANGNFWEKQTLVLNTTAGQKNDIPVAVTFFGERRTAWLKQLKVGQLVEVACAMESREFNGKWFTDVQGYGLTPYQRAGGNVDAPEPQGGTQVQMPVDDPGF